MPFLAVKNVFLEIEKKHIEYVIDCLNKNDNKFKINQNTKSYLMTSLFNSTRTISYYFEKPEKAQASKSSFDMEAYFDKIRRNKELLKQDNDLVVDVDNDVDDDFFGF
jgi:hypothetical protein